VLTALDSLLEASPERAVIAAGAATGYHQTNASQWLLVALVGVVRLTAQEHAAESLRLSKHVMDPGPPRPNVRGV
jgi:hypothetical protein